MDQVRVIERSLRCCVAGCLGLIPVLGLLPALVAIVLHHQVQAEVKGGWNPARSHLAWGVSLAWCGVLLTTLAVGIQVARVLQR